MKGTILKIEEIYDDVECKTKYQTIIWFENKPKLMLGECEVVQK